MTDGALLIGQHPPGIIPACDDAVRVGKTLHFLEAAHHHTTRACARTNTFSTPQFECRAVCFQRHALQWWAVVVYGTGKMPHARKAYVRFCSSLPCSAVEEPGIQHKVTGK